LIWRKAFDFKRGAPVQGEVAQIIRIQKTKRAPSAETTLTFSLTFLVKQMMLRVSEHRLSPKIGVAHVFSKTPKK
jgi:hypothetical protein